MITFLLFVNFGLMILLPVLLASWIQRRWRPGLALFGIGAATFVLSQVGHIPFNLIVQQSPFYPQDVDSWRNLLLVAAFLGLSSGIFEEVARYLTYRFWAKKARSWPQGMMVGAGHGGIEAIIFGLLGLINFTVLLLISQGTLQDVIPTDQMPLVQQQIDATFGVPWYMALLGAVERVWALALHLAASLLVMQSVTRRQWRWLLAAIGLHALFNGAALVIVNRVGPLATEVALGVFAVFCVLIILKLRDGDGGESGKDKATPEMERETAVPMKPIEATAERLDDSRYA